MADGSVQVEWRRTVPDLEALGPEWRRLEQSVQHRTPFASFDYLSTWYRHYAGDYGGDPLVGTARRGTELVGVAPLVVRRARLGRVPVTRVSFAIHDNFAGEFLVQDDQPHIVEAFVDSLVRSLRFDVLCLNGFETGSDGLRALQQAGARHHLALETTSQLHAIVDVHDGYDTYCRTMSRNFRRSVKRQAADIAAAGETQISGVMLDQGADRQHEGINRLIAITEASYKLAGQPLAAIHRDFLGDLVRRFAPRGMLALPILSIGGRDAAFLMGLVERGCFYDVSLAYAERFAHLSPGAYLMQESIRRLASAGVHTVVSHGAHPYKRRWSTAFMPTSQVNLFMPTLRAAASRVIRFSLSSLWQRFGVAPK
jgi:CelD/BcsL family acetyltransferase involved in cellulose biosynthesis